MNKIMPYNDDFTFNDTIGINVYIIDGRLNYLIILNYV